MGTPVHCVESDCSDVCEVDSNPEMLGSVRDTVNSLPAAVDVVLPGVSLVMFAGTAAVPVCLPAITGVVPPDVFAEEVAAVVIYLADGGTVTDGVTIQTETGNKLSTELLESVWGTNNGVRADVDVASPDMSPAVFAGAAAVPVSLSAITGVVSSAVFTEGVVATPLVDVRMVTDRVIVLPDAGSELPAVFAEVAAVCAASSAEAEEITFGLAVMDSGGSVSRADIAEEFSDVADEQNAVGGSTWTAVVPVNMVNIQTDNFGDDQFSPGVGCCADMAYREMIVIVLRTVGVGHPVTLILMTSESMRQSAIGTLLREPRVFGTPMACRRTRISYI